MKNHINSLISLLMTIAAIVYMIVMGAYCDDNWSPSILLATPPLALLAGAMYFLIKPDTKLEW